MTADELKRELQLFSNWLIGGYVGESTIIELLNDDSVIIDYIKNYIENDYNENDL